MYNHTPGPYSSVSVSPNYATIGSRMWRPTEKEGSETIERQESSAPGGEERPRWHKWAVHMASYLATPRNIWRHCSGLSPTQKVPACYISKRDQPDWMGFPDPGLQISPGQRLTGTAASAAANWPLTRKKAAGNAIRNPMDWSPVPWARLVSRSSFLHTGF